MSMDRGDVLKGEQRKRIVFVQENELVDFFQKGELVISFYLDRNGLIERRLDSEGQQGFVVLQQLREEGVQCSVEWLGRLGVG